MRRSLVEVELLRRRRLQLALDFHWNLARRRLLLHRGVGRGCGGDGGGERRPQDRHERGLNDVDRLLVRVL